MLLGRHLTVKTCFLLAWPHPRGSLSYMPRFIKPITLDCGCEVHMAGLDFSVAFDCVNHKALISKLRQLGVGGPFLNILTEFLSNRLQRVDVDGQFNDYRNVILGVP